MFLIICSQAILVPQNMLQRIDRHVSMSLQNLVFCMSPPRFIDILAGTADILYHTQTFFVVINILDMFYANCNQE